jgi:hypothetical protein
MKLTEVTGYSSHTASILKESYQDLTESQMLYLGKFEKELWPLVEQYTKLAEATLTKDQVMSIFQGAEETAMASGDNKTVAGKVGAGVAAAAKLPVDMAKAVDEKIKELGRMAQKAGPIKNADQKFEQLKKDITAKNGDSKIVQGIQKVSDWAKENPGKASLAVGILTTIAAFAGGPVGGAAAGLILRASKDLLQGEKLSTAIGRSVKTAAYGAIAGWAMRGIGDWLEGLRADAVPYDKVPGLTQVDVGVTKTLSGTGFKSVQDLGSMIVPADQAEQFSSLVQAARGGDIDSFNELWNFSKTFDVNEFNELRNATNDMLQAVAQQNDAFLQNLTLANDAVAAIAQGTASGKMDANDVKVDGEPVEDEENPNVVKGNESLSMEDKFDLYLQEGPMDALKKAGSAVKGAVGKAAGAVGGAVKQAGKDIGNKVTANKLMKMWKSMGEPLDSGSIANILQDAGMTDDQIKGLSQTQKVELDPAEKPAADAPVDDTGTDAATGTDTQTKSTGITKEVGGVTYSWEGALWVDANTKKPVGIEKAMQMGLGNPKFDSIIAAAKKDPALKKLIVQQVTAAGVKPGTAAAQQAQQAGVKGDVAPKTA